MAKSWATDKRVVVESVSPQVDGGKFPAKSTMGDPVAVEADVFADGQVWDITLAPPARTERAGLTEDVIPVGADVTKVEPPIGDETRTWGPPFWGDPAEGLSAYFSAVNRNKRTIAVDLKSPGGVEVVLRTGRNLLEGDLLGRSATEQHRKLVQQCAARDEVPLLGGELEVEHPPIPFNPGEELVCETEPGPGRQAG